MTNVLKILCNSLRITENSFHDKKCFIYKGIEEREQFTAPIRYDEKLIYYIVSQYTQLKREGNQYSGLCPFHQDTNPSFKVGLKDGEGYKFHCFDCDKMEDLIDFIMQWRI